MLALIIGATGATGKDLLNILLEDNAFQQVHIFVRRDPGIQHEKLFTHIINFDKKEEWQHLVKGDVLFSCLGTTLKAAGSKEAQWKIDYDYQFQFAQSARHNNVENYVLVSAGNASPNSSIFYSKMKGQLEEAVKSLGFSKLSIFRPPLLARKNSERKMEVAAMKALNFLNKLGILSSQKPMPTHILAKAMKNAAKSANHANTIFEAKEIWKLAEVDLANEKNYY